MRALVIKQWGTTPSLCDVPAPVPGPGEVLIRVRACGAGRTVLNVIDGDLTDCAPEHLPRIPGHEVAGEVAAAGPDVEGLREGDRVVTYFYLTCGTCPMCRSGREPLCENFRGFVGAHRDGGYAEYMTAPARNCFRFPASIEFTEATTIPDAILSPLHMLGSRRRVTPDDRVVVIGAGGGLGLHLIQVARLFGSEVWGVDVHPEKAEAIRECGARDALDFRETPAQVMHDVAGGATVVVDLVGRPSSLHWGARVLGPGGTLVVVTTFPGVTTTISPREIVFREQTIVGSRYGTANEMSMAIDLVARGKIRPVVTEAVPLAQAEKLHAKLREGALIGRGAVIP